MNSTLNKYLVRIIRRIADDLEVGNCEMSEDEQLEAINLFTHKALSKEQACEYLHIKRSRFDDLIRNGKLPKGRKRKGHKELVWYEDELFTADNKFNSN